MCLIIASQMTEAMNGRIRLLPSAPTVAAISVGQWATVMDADMFVVAPVLSWHPSPPRPAGWPGRLRWICFASAGVDFYPRWLLEVPLLTCARGVASEEIADYVMAAIYLPRCWTVKVTL
ncbi:hypothetical protein [Sphingomonas bacterium]|uniref:hypothetical protein n=1 Tax=Sphingomonas bacterium TaxID=1895847 RepID=UPI0015762847|nr:hypothetical protein [Sphingomonas bacterium]